MSSLSRRTRAQLHALQASVVELARQRSMALRMLVASRRVITATAQRDFWLEFALADQEYRLAVRRLAQFCAARSTTRGGTGEPSNGA